MKTPITVRIDADLLSQARRRAREDNRTLTNFIETVLRQTIAERAAPLPNSAAPEVTAGRSNDRPSHVT